jgi:molybdopterin synthase catalytic subunit
VKLLYFAWVRERIGKAEEQLDPPPGVATIGELMTWLALQREPFDSAAEVAKLTGGRTDIGAVVTFTGVCRADENGRPIAALTLEHYPGMAEAEIARHVEEAHARWPLLGITVIHRHGRIIPGEVIVLVVTVSSHREAAFAAASFLMDYLKTRAPFWKRVETADGTSWVDAKAADDAAAERWASPPERRHEAAK